MNTAAIVVVGAAAVGFFGVVVEAIVVDTLGSCHTWCVEAVYLSFSFSRVDLSCLLMALLLALLLVLGVVKDGGLPTPLCSLRRKPRCRLAWLLLSLVVLCCMAAWISLVSITILVVCVLDFFVSGGNFHMIVVFVSERSLLFKSKGPTTEVLYKHPPHHQKKNPQTTNK